MGKATRWLKNLLGGKRDNKENSNSNSNANSYPIEKKRWSFGKSTRDNPSSDTTSARARRPTNLPRVPSSAWLKSLYDETEREQSKHAIAVAAATAAAADAAVAAAQAAVEVVRLTSQGRGMNNVYGGVGTGTGMVISGMVTTASEKFAAVKIQTAFRGFLAKKALRALKALVKLQALVRGYLVRKQATATLHSMQAMIRAQATAQKTRNLIRHDRNLLHNHQYRHRRSLQERYDNDTRSELGAYCSRRLSASLEAGSDRSPKIVEIDTVRPKSRSSRRTSPSNFDPSEDLPPISIPSTRNLQEYDWYLSSNDKCRFSLTAQSTPRYITSSNIMPVTPAKSVANLQNYPNYMINTQSFEAKVRSHSAPKQRPEPVGPNRKRMPLSEVMLESRASLSGVGMQKSCYKAQQEGFNFKSAVVDRLDRSTDLGREMEREFYLQRKW